MRPIRYIVCLSLILLPAAVQAETFELKYASLEEVGFEDRTVSQVLRPLENPPVDLKGIPDPGAGRVWILEAQLGTGSKNTFPMAVLLSEDNTTITWFFDVNRNNDLSDDRTETQPLVAQKVSFLPRDFIISIGDAERPYRAHLELLLYDYIPYCYFRPDCCYTGTITLDGKNYIAALIDSHANGLFNNSKRNTDKLYLWDPEKRPYSRDGKNQPGRRIWKESAQTVIQNGQWHLLDPEPDGTAIHYLGKAEQPVALETGFKTLFLEIFSERTGVVMLFDDDAPLMLPPGEYRWLTYEGILHLPDKKLLSFESGTIMNEPFTVETGRKNRLELCLPLTQLLTARVKGDTVTFEESFEGRSKEDVRLNYADSRWAPKFTVSDQEGNVLLYDIFAAG